MSNVWFIGDLHAGHANIHKFRHFVTSEENNREIIERDWRERVKKKDVVYVLGDAAFTQEGLDWIGTLPGIKYLVRGNHDELSTTAYLEVFKEVYGIVRYKGYWLTHAPIHPAELRGKINLHGHVHYSSIHLPYNSSQDIEQELDLRYLNCSVEGLRSLWNGPWPHPCLVSLNEVREIRPSGRKDT